VPLPARPTLLVLTKADIWLGPRPSSLAPDRLLVSAQTGQGIPDLLAWCRAHLPESPFCYDPEYSSTQPLRFFAAEFVREAAFAQLGDELPYALAVEVEEFRERSEPVYIRAIIFVERDSQKAMVIGKDGRMIKALGTEARSAIEGFLGARVFLDLWVKVLPNWRSRADALQRFGFSVPTSRHA
jgi:GTP-binding protein Era